MAAAPATVEVKTAEIRAIKDEISSIQAQIRAAQTLIALAIRRHDRRPRSPGRGLRIARAGNQGARDEPTYGEDEDAWHF
jgi:hypothetical protein